MLVSLHPKYSQGSFVRIFKSVTAQQLFKVLQCAEDDICFVSGKILTTVKVGISLATSVFIFELKRANSKNIKLKVKTIITGATADK